MASPLRGRVYHSKHLSEKQPRRQVMKNLFDMQNMSHSITQIFINSICVEVSLCPKATGVEFETTKDYHSFYNYRSGIVFQTYMELGSRKNMKRFGINWFKNNIAEPSLRYPKQAWRDPSFSFKRSKGLSISLENNNYLNCINNSSNYNLRVNRRTFSTRVGMDGDVVALEKEIKNLPIEELNKASTEDKIKSRVNNLIADDSIIEFLKQSRDNKGYYKNLFNVIVSENNLKLAWYEIKGKSRNLSPGEDREEETLDELWTNWLKETNKKLMEDTYKYRPAKRIKIPKTAGKSGTRPLIITSPRDKVILQAFHRILQPLFEGISIWSEASKEEYDKANKNRNTFQKMQKVRKKEGGKFYIKQWILPNIFTQHSHGFRPTRSCHTALQEIDFIWRPISWLVNCDISKAFNKVNHHILMKRFNKYIKDQQLINELWKMIKTKVVDFKLRNTLENSLEIPQGSVLSQLLFNVYMHELDKLAIELMVRIGKDPTKKINPIYTKLKYEYMKNFYNTPWNIQHKQQKKFAAEARKRGVNRYIKSKNTLGIKMFYIRYIDNILFGFYCPKELAKKQLNIVNKYIKDNLHLEVRSMDLIHASSGSVNFLGFTLTQWSERTSKRNPSKALAAFKRAKARVKHRLSDESQWYWKMVEQAGKTMYWRLHEEFRKWDPNVTQYSKATLEKLFRNKAFLDAIDTFKKLEAEQTKLIEGRSKLPNTLPKKSKKLEWSIKSREEKGKIKFKRWVEGAHNLIESDAIMELTQALGDSTLAKQIIETRSAFLKALEKPLVEQQIEREFIQKLVRKVNTSTPKAHITDKKTNSAALSILFPVIEMRKKFQKNFFINKNGTPRSVPAMTIARDEEIISNFAAKARGIMKYYRPSHNLWEVKRVVNWTLRYSLLATLGQKHKKSISWAIKTFGKDPKAYATLEDGSQIILAAYPTKKSINEVTKGFPKNISFWTHKKMMALLENQRINRFNRAEAQIFNRCAVKGCRRTPSQIFHIKKLNKIWKEKLIGTQFIKEKSLTPEIKYYKSALARNQIPLCADHHLKLEKGQINSDILKKGYTISGISAKFR